MRTRFQGLLNVMAFNWPYYVLATVVVFALGAAAARLAGSLQILCLLGAAFALAFGFASIVVTIWVHDLSGLYRLDWLARILGAAPRRVLVVTAGLDEVSAELHSRWPEARLALRDFYDANLSPAASIRRARAAVRRPGGGADNPRLHEPEMTGPFDLVLVFMAAHEIRELEPRADLLRGLGAELTSDGRMVVVEHLRDCANFLAYNIGYRHFLSASDWHRSFGAAGLRLERELKHTPFVTIFALSSTGARA